MFAVGAHRGVAVGVGSSQDLRPDHHLFSGYFKILQADAKEGFCLACSIHLRGVEIVDALLDGQLDDGLVGGEVVRVGAGGRAEGKSGYLEAGVAEVVVPHGRMMINLY